ncbi:MAG: RNA-binding cell elongation regulator Jag/EloR [Tissierellia bacterium]|nr:RNA-binding cell elongation regulator Jag/EloR [Tissierellia bacterium]
MNVTIQSGDTVDEAVKKALDELNTTKDRVKIEVLEEASKGFLGLIGKKEALVKVSIKIDTRDLLEEILEDRPLSGSYFSQDRKEEDFLGEEKAKKSPKKASKKEETSLFIDPVDEENIGTPKGQDQEVDFEGLIREYLDLVLSSMNLDYELKIRQEDRIYHVDIEGEEESLGIVIGKRGNTLDAIQYILSLIINRYSDVYLRVFLDCSGYREKRRDILISLAEKMANKAIKTDRPIKLEPMNAAERKIIHTALQDFDGIMTHSEGKDPYRRIVIQKQRKY